MAGRRHLRRRDRPAGRGAGLLAAYAAGIGVPFLAAALFTGAFLRFAERWRGRLAAIEMAMGFAVTIAIIRARQAAMTDMASDLSG